MTGPPVQFRLLSSELRTLELSTLNSELRTNKVMSPKRSIRDEIQWRAKVTFGIVFLIGSLVAAQIFVIQVFQKKKWLGKVEKV